MASMKELDSHRVFLDTIRANLENDYETELPSSFIDVICKIFESVIQENSEFMQKKRLDDCIKSQTSKTAISALRWIETERLGKYDPSNPISIQPATQSPLKELIPKSVEDQLLPTRQLSKGEYYTKVNYNEQVIIGNQTWWLEGKNLKFVRIGGSQPPKPTIWIAEKTTGDRYVWRSSKQVDKTDLKNLFQFLLTERTNVRNFPSIHVNAGTHGNESGEGAHEKGDKRLTDKRIKKEARQALTLACLAVGISLKERSVYDKFSIHQVSSYSPNIYPREADHIIDPQCKGANSMVPKTCAGLDEDLMFLYNPNSNDLKISPSSASSSSQSGSSKALDPVPSLSQSSSMTRASNPPSLQLDSASSQTPFPLLPLRTPKISPSSQPSKPPSSQITLPCLQSSSSKGLDPAPSLSLSSSMTKVSGPMPSNILDAAATGHIEAMKLMVAKDPELIRTVDNSGRTPLHLAAQQGHVGAITFLLEQDSQQRRAFDERQQYALSFRLPKPTLISIVDNKGHTPLHLATQQGFVEAMKLLLEQDPQMIRSVDKYGYTLLHWAAQQGQVEAMKFLLKQDPQLIDTLTINGLTPLHLAAYGGQIEAAKYLVSMSKKPGFINQKSHEGKTAYGYAVAQGKKDFQIWISSVGGV